MLTCCCCVKNTASVGLIAAPVLKQQTTQPVTEKAADQTDAVMITDSEDVPSVNDDDEIRSPRKRTRRTSKRASSTSRSRSRVTRSKKKLQNNDDPDWAA